MVRASGGRKSGLTPQSRAQRAACRIGGRFKLQRDVADFKVLVQFFFGPIQQGARIDIGRCCHQVRGERNVAGALNAALRIFLRVVQQSLQTHCPGAVNADPASLHLGAVAFIHRFSSDIT